MPAQLAQSLLVAVSGGQRISEYSDKVGQSDGCA
jgi:hypothetical protein